MQPDLSNLNSRLIWIFSTHFAFAARRRFIIVAHSHAIMPIIKAGINKISLRQKTGGTDRVGALILVVVLIVTCMIYVGITGFLPSATTHGSTNQSSNITSRT